MKRGLNFMFPCPMTSLENRVPGPFNILVHVPGTCALICYINVYVTAVLIVSHKCKGLLPGTYFYVDILYMYTVYHHCFRNQRVHQVKHQYVSYQSQPRRSTCPRSSTSWIKVTIGYQDET